MTTSNLKHRLKSLETENQARLAAWVEAKYGPVFDSFVSSLSNEELNYRERTLTGESWGGKDDPIIDWTIEAKLYQAFENLKVVVPAEILNHLEEVEKELKIPASVEMSPLNRVNRVVAHLQEA